MGRWNSPLKCGWSIRSEPRTGKWLVQGHQSAKEMRAEGEKEKKRAERLRRGFEGVPGSARSEAV